eukprot:jgi/Psemu1/29570/gm1.29570_g
MSGSASAVCDGSYDPILLRGTSSFILSPNTSTKALMVFLTGSNLVSGSPEDQSSYRSELAGIIGVLTCCFVLMDLYDVASSSLTIALDGDTALQQAQGTWPLSICQKSFDYVYVIRNMLSALPITVTFKWVQGHQEGLSLDWWALCNHQVDGMAKAFLSMHRSSPYHYPRLVFEPWALSQNGLKCSRFDRDALHILILGPPLLHYWHTHHNISIPPQVSNSIHWCAHHSAFKRLPPGMQRWFVKFASGCIGVGNRLLHYQHQDHSRCPLCAQDEEKVSHVLSCADPGAVQHCLSSFRGPLQQRLTSELTDPSLALAIVDVTTTRVRQGRRIHPSSYSPDIASAIRAQRRIGWHNWFLGRWTPLWHQIQADYYSLIGSKRSPRRWTTAVIHQFFLTCWDLWTYWNQRLHGTGGSLESEQHQSLNDSISSELAIGLAGALPQSHSLLQIPLQVLRGYTLTAKRQWLATIQLARRHFAAPLQSQQPYRQEAALMRAWLHGA